MFASKGGSPEEAEDYELSRDKVYCLYFGSDWNVLRFKKKARINNVTYYCFTPAEEGFGHGKNVYLQLRVVHQFYEFDSLEEYRQHFDAWRDEERERKFKGEYD